MSAPASNNNAADTVSVGRRQIWMMCAPFLVAAGLFASMLLAPWTGMTGPSSNTYFLFGVAATGIGIIAGVAGLLRMRRSPAWVPVLVGLLYVPTILISLLLSGA